MNRVHSLSPDKRYPLISDRTLYKLSAHETRRTDRSYDRICSMYNCL